MEDDRKQGGVFDTLGGLYNSFSNLRSLSQLGNIITRVGAVLVPEAAPWVPVFLVICLIVIPVVLILLGGVGFAGQLGGNQPSPSGNLENVVISENCTTLEESPYGCLKSKFNIEVQGLFDKELAKDVYKAFSIAYNGSSLYRERWGNGNRKMILRFVAPDLHDAEGLQTCSAQAKTAGDERKAYDEMLIYNNLNQNGTYVCGLTSGIGYLIIHETGHVLADRNRNTLFADFTNQLPSLQTDPCYSSSGFLKTYIGPGQDVAAEDFAESIAEFVVHNSWQTGAGISNFKNTCPKTYSWFYTNIFGTDVANSYGL